MFYLAEGNVWANLFSNLLTPELVGMVLTVLVAWWKGSGWYQKVQDSRAEKGYEFVAAAVHETYESYVKEIKAGRKDGKLTADERELARRKAIDAAKEYAKEHGFDLLK